MSRDMMLGVDIGGTNLRLALIDKEYNLSNQYITTISNIPNDNLLDKLFEVIDSYLDDVDGEVKGMGIGVPGIVDNKQRVISCPNVTGLEERDLKEIFENKFNLPVLIDKDVNLIMLAEYNKLDEKVDNAIGYFIGTGFGCSMVIRGEIYKGSRGFAGELGHIPLKGKERVCNCGSAKGCLELYAAGRMVEEKAEERGIEIENFFLEVDKETEEIKELLDNMAIGIATAVNLLDPEVIIIDGGVVNMKGFPMDDFEKEFKKYLRADIIREELKIVSPKVGKFAGCLGGGIFCFDNLY